MSLPGYLFGALYMMLTSSLMPLHDRWVGGEAGFTFDAFDLMHMENKFMVLSHILIRNGSVYLGI